MKKKQKKYSNGGQLLAGAASFIPGLGQIIAPLILAGDQMRDQSQQALAQQQANAINPIQINTNPFGKAFGGPLDPPINLQVPQMPISNTFVAPRPNFSNVVLPAISQDWADPNKNLVARPITEAMGYDPNDASSSHSKSRERFREKALGGLVNDNFKQYNTGSHNSGNDQNIDQFGNPTTEGIASIQNKENMFNVGGKPFIMSDTLTNPDTGNKFSVDALKINNKFPEARFQPDQKNTLEFEMGNLALRNNLAKSRAESKQMAEGGPIIPPGKSALQYQVTDNGRPPVSVGPQYGNAMDEMLAASSGYFNGIADQIRHNGEKETAALYSMHENIPFRTYTKSKGQTGDPVFFEDPSTGKTMQVEGDKARTILSKYYKKDPEQGYVLRDGNNPKTAEHLRKNGAIQNLANPDKFFAASMQTAGKYKFDSNTAQPVKGSDGQFMVNSSDGKTKLTVNRSSDGSYSLAKEERIKKYAQGGYIDPPKTNSIFDLGLTLDQNVDFMDSVPPSDNLMFNSNPGNINFNSQNEVPTIPRLQLPASLDSGYSNQVVGLPDTIKTNPNKTLNSISERNTDGGRRDTLNSGQIANGVALATKGYALGQNIVDAIKPAEQEKLILPDYGRANNYFREANIDYSQARQDATGASNILSNVNRSMSGNASAYQARQASRVGALQDTLSRISEAQNNAQSQLNVTKGQYETNKAVDTANRKYQNQQGNMQNDAMSRYADRNLASNLSQIGTEFNQYSVQQAEMKNRTEIANMQTTQAIAYMQAKYPSIQFTPENIEAFKKGEISLDQLIQVKI